MALQRSLLLCGLLWWHEGVATPLGPPFPAVSHPLSVWHGARHRPTDPSPHDRHDHRGYHPHNRDRGLSQPESSFQNIPVDKDAYERRSDYGRLGNERSYRMADQADRQDVYNRNKKPLNRYDQNKDNSIRNRAFFERGDDKFSFQKQNNKRYDRYNEPDVERMFITSDPFRRRIEVGNFNTKQRNVAPKEDSYSPNSRHQQQGQSNSFNGGGSYATNNFADNPRSNRYHFIENAKTGRESNFLHQHRQSSSNVRHFRFLSDGFRGPISSGHYEDVPGTSGGYYRRPGGLTNNYNDVTSSLQPKSPSPLLQSNQGNEEYSYRDARVHTPKKFPERTSEGYHESYIEGSATNNGFRNDRHKLSDLRLQKEEHSKIPIQPQLLVKDVELPNPQPHDTSSHHPYSLLYFHYIPHGNSSKKSVGAS